jgi:hypothetical protein
MSDQNEELEEARGEPVQGEQEMRRRVVIFEKGDLLACMSMADNGKHASMLTYDSRLAHLPSGGVKDARALLPSSQMPGYMASQIKATLSRGWRAVYDGEPNYG